MIKQIEFTASCDRVESGPLGKIAVLIRDDDEKEYTLKPSASDNMCEGRVYLCREANGDVTVIKRLTGLEEKRKKEAAELFERLKRKKN